MWKDIQSELAIYMKRKNNKLTSLLPTVAQQVGTAQADGNVTGASDTLIGLTTLFYALSIATAAIAIASVGLRNSGMM